MTDRKLQRAQGIAQREWAKLRTALRQCGDVGDLTDADIILDPDRVQGWEGETPHVAAPDLIELDRWMERQKKSPEMLYHCVAAQHVYAALGIVTARRLGLTGQWAYAFGDGVGCVRSRFSSSWGNLDFESSSLERVFDDTIGERKYHDRSMMQWNWSHDDPDVQAAFAACLEMFRGWIAEPEEYERRRSAFWG